MNLTTAKGYMSTAVNATKLQFREMLGGAARCTLENEKTQGDYFASDNVIVLPKGYFISTYCINQDLVRRSDFVSIILPNITVQLSVIY